MNLSYVELIPDVILVHLHDQVFDPYLSPWPDSKPAVLLLVYHTYLCLSCVLYSKLHEGRDSVHSFNFVFSELQCLACGGHSVNAGWLTEQTDEWQPWGAIDSSYEVNDWLDYISILERSHGEQSWMMNWRRIRQETSEDLGVLLRRKLGSDAASWRPQPNPMKSSETEIALQVGLSLRRCWNFVFLCQSFAEWRLPQESSTTFSKAILFNSSKSEEAL